MPHSSDVDFDKVPSPRESPASYHRRSLGKPRLSGRSQLSQAPATQDDNDNEPAYNGFDYGGQDFGDGGFASDDDDVLPTPSKHADQSRRTSGHTSRRTSFAQMDQADEEEEERVAHFTDNEPTPKAKGKQRASEVLSHEDPDIEDEIAQGLEEPVEEDQENEEPLRKRTGHDRGNDDSTEKHQPVSKRARTENEGDGNEGAKKPRGRPKGSKNNVLRDGPSLYDSVRSRNCCVHLCAILVTPNDENTDGRRRGQRLRYKPLDWWRLEKVVYGRRETGTSYVPTIKEIRRIPKEEPPPLGGKHRRKRPPRSQSKTAEVDALDALAFNPEDGWDEETQPEGPVLDFFGKEEIVKREWSKVLPSMLPGFSSIQVSRTLRRWLRRKRRPTGNSTFRRSSVMQTSSLPGSSPFLPVGRNLRRVPRTTHLYAIRTDQHAIHILTSDLRSSMSSRVR